LTIDD
jgi:hypothetical protein